MTSAAAMRVRILQEDEPQERLTQYVTWANPSLLLQSCTGGCGEQRWGRLAGGERDDLSGHHTAERAGKPDSDRGKRDAD